MTFTTGGPTLYTPAGTTQKRSSNTGQQETFNGNEKIASQAVLVVKTLNEGPTLNGINVIKDSLLTVYSQATLKYAAKLTLKAHLPGNGMGGSTKPITIAEPTISTSGVTACGVNQVGAAIGTCAATGCSAEKTGAPKNEYDFDKPLCCNVAANQPANIKAAGIRPTKLTVPAGAGLGYVEWNSVGAIAEAQLKSKNAAGTLPSPTSAAGVVNRNTQASNEGLTYPAAEQLTQSAAGIVTAPASGCTNLRANAYGVGNSLATADISQFPVAAAAAGSTCKNAYNALTAGGATALAATSISAQANAAGTIATAAAPNTYCIGPSVGYLSPYYIGSSWASEPATATTAAVLGGQFNYLQLLPPTLGATYNTNAAGVATQGLNPNTIAAVGQAWVAGGAAGGAQRGARQGFAYNVVDIVSQQGAAVANRDWARPPPSATRSSSVRSRLAPAATTWAVRTAWPALTAGAKPARTTPTVPRRATRPPRTGPATRSRTSWRASRSSRSSPGRCSRRSPPTSPRTPLATPLSGRRPSRTAPPTCRPCSPSTPMPL